MFDQLSRTTKNLNLERQENIIVEKILSHVHSALMSAIDGKKNDEEVDDLLVHIGRKIVHKSAGKT